MKTKFAAAVLLSLAAMTSAHAQEGFYAGALLSRVDFSDDSGATGDASPTAVGFKVGAAINKNFAVEGRVLTGLSDDSTDFGGLDATLDVDSVFGVYAKGILPLSDAASLYGLVGYSRLKLKLDVPALGASGSDSDSDVSLGFGADFSLNESTSLGIEYLQLFSDDGVKVNGLTLGLSFKF
jgi:outer membrane immunogenic protein